MPSPLPTLNVSLAGYPVAPASLVGFDTHQLPQETVDVCVLGSGAAGFSAALAAAAGKQVLVLTKGPVYESNTQYAQGGIAVELDESPDGLTGHVADTLAAGHGLCDEHVVTTVVNEGPARMRDLLGRGAEFDRADGHLAITREGGHSRARVLHAGGDMTGREIQRTLSMAAFNHERIRLYEKAFAVEFLVTQKSEDPDGPRCVGVLFRRGDDLRVVWAATTILCSGGAGMLFRETTNPAVATGDGMAMAFRAGAVLRDMEFIQFHPTTLYLAGSARVLITEAIRGEGALLRNKAGKRFMPDYHPLAELAPRDAVSRAIVAEMRETGDTAVYLDVTHLDIAAIKVRFPSFAHVCEMYGLDMSREWVPVRPTAHYMIGGVKTDLDGRTSIPGLLAAGEASASGLHGANRLGSNSLLEALVLGHRAGTLALNAPAQPGPIGRWRIKRAGPGRTAGADEVDTADLSNAIRAMMLHRMGVNRRGHEIEEGLEKLASWARLGFRIQFADPGGWTMQNALTLAGPMMAAGLARQESRGVHFREDFPEQDPRFAGHIEIGRPSHAG